MDRIAEFDSKNGINCKKWTIAEIAKMWMLFIKVMVFSTILSVFFTAPKPNAQKKHYAAEFWCLSMSHTHAHREGGCEQEFITSTNSPKCNHIGIITIHMAFNHKSAY